MLCLIAQAKNSLYNHHLEAKPATTQKRASETRSVSDKGHTRHYIKFQGLKKTNPKKLN